MSTSGTEFDTHTSVQGGHARRWFRVSLQDKLLASICTLVAAAILLTAAAVATHTTQTLSAAAADTVPADVWDHATASAGRAVGASSLAALAFVLPGVYVLVARAFEPINRLHDAATAVTNGRFETVDFHRPNDAFGRLAKTFNVMIDRLREQKQIADDANARLIDANVNLERLVEARTRDAEATSRRLRREIDERGDFFRAVSHDLGAPLRNIDGMVASVLRRHADALPADAVRRLERVRHNVAVESELIGEVLELSRIKSRGGEAERVSVSELVWALRGVFADDLQRHEIEIIVETELPPLLAEKPRVRQVFQNLIDNAIKYMGTGPVREIRIGAGGCPGGGVEFWVKDTGIGIIEAEAEKVFYAFRRGSNHGGVAGKGVGLAGVKAIIETLDGTIRCEANAPPEPGTTFRFTVGAGHVARSQTVFRRAATPAASAADLLRADDDALYGGATVNESATNDLAA